MSNCPTEAEVIALRHCYELAASSLDPSTQNAAVLLDAVGTILWATASVNAFPVGVACTEERWLRPAKYLYVEHAERNALYAAARRQLPTLGATMVCPWAPCADCARAIIQSGIRRLVRRENTGNTHERWAEAVAIGDQLLCGAGVQIIDCAVFFGDVPPVRRNGSLLQP